MTGYEEIPVEGLMQDAEDLARKWFRGIDAADPTVSMGIGYNRDVLVMGLAWGILSGMSSAYGHQALNHVMLKKQDVPHFMTHAAIRGVRVTRGSSIASVEVDEEPPNVHHG